MGAMVEMQVALHGAVRAASRTLIAVVMASNSGKSNTRRGRRLARAGSLYSVDHDAHSLAVVRIAVRPEQRRVQAAHLGQPCLRECVPVLLVRAEGEERRRHRLGLTSLANGREGALRELAKRERFWRRGGHLRQLGRQHPRLPHHRLQGVGGGRRATDGAAVLGAAQLTPTVRTVQVVQASNVGLLPGDNKGEGAGGPRVGNNNSPANGGQDQGNHERDDRYQAWPRHDELDDAKRRLRFLRRRGQLIKATRYAAHWSPQSLGHACGARGDAATRMSDEGAAMHWVGSSLLVAGARGFSCGLEPPTWAVVR
eukprot:scaffold652_cov100-Isochrysis_galbana.AAC.9